MTKRNWQILLVNVISLTRIVVVPIMWIYREALALVVLLTLVGLLTDAIDGSLARKWKVQTSTGMIVDNTSDAILLFFSFYLLVPFYIFVIYCVWSAYFFSCDNWLLKKKGRLWAWQGIIWWWSAVIIDAVFIVCVVIQHFPQWSWALAFIACLAVMTWKRERILGWRRRYTPYVYKD